MTAINPQPQSPETEDALRRLILRRAREINGKILTSLAVVSDDLDDNNYLGAIGGLDGLESEIDPAHAHSSPFAPLGAASFLHNLL